MMAVALAGCQESMENIVLSEKTQTFEAIMEGFEGNTKTSIDNQKNILWSENDQLAIFQGCSVADKYQVTAETAGTGNGTFELIADNSGEVNDDFNSGVEIAANIALYPYAEGLAVSNTNVTDGNDVGAYEITGFVLPEIQHYVPNSFGEGTFPMVAVTETMSDHTLRFKNLMGAIKLQLKGTQTIKSIKIEGKGNEKLSGTATVTAYANGITPAVTMTGTDEASKSVTLDCGDGVELAPSTATDFIIALPPVLFSQGFAVTVTYSDDTTNTIETTTANTVLRSSILTMPILVLGDESVKEEDKSEGEEGLKIPISSFSLNLSDTKILVSNTVQLEMTSYKPADATELTLTWSSSDETIAKVDQNGNVTGVGDGTAKVTALAVGGVSGICFITVVVPKKATIDYVDEYDINHGKGVSLGDMVWAPVNCGYKATVKDSEGNIIDYGYPYGKLYQWGRKYGQGYSEEYDTTVPEIVDGGVSLAGGQHSSNANKFYKSVTYNWLAERNDELWNAGTESSPIKTDYDPCPSGWRVPTYAELDGLRLNNSDWIVNENNQSGRFFSGYYKYAEDSDKKIFLPASGERSTDLVDGDARNRGDEGYYWSSRTGGYWDNGSGSGAYLFRFSIPGGSMGTARSRADGYSVRCVQE